MGERSVRLRTWTLEKTKKVVSRVGKWSAEENENRRESKTRFKYTIQ